jgi:uncharacterized protein (DUF111 family)
VPAPATADLLRDATIYSKHATTELVTAGRAPPSSRRRSTAFTGLNGFAAQKIGYGAGPDNSTVFPIACA